MGKPYSLNQTKSKTLLVLNQRKFCKQKDLRFKENKIKYQNNKKKKNMEEKEKEKRVHIYVQDLIEFLVFVHFTIRAPIQLMQGGIQSLLTNQQVKLRGCVRQLVPDLHQANPSKTVTLIILSRRRKLRLTIIENEKEKEYKEREEKVLVCNGEMSQIELFCFKTLSKRDNLSLICRVFNKDNKPLMY